MPSESDIKFSNSRVLGLDLGERRIGVAVSDLLGWTAQGIATIDRQKNPNWMSELDKIMEEYQITHVVVGLPKNMNGSIGPRGQVCQQIAEEIQDRYQVPVTLWDERLSTSAVEKTLISADISRRKRKKVVDQVAATWILQGYLDSKRR